MEVAVTNGQSSRNQITLKIIEIHGDPCYTWLIVIFQAIFIQIKPGIVAYASGLIDTQIQVQIFAAPSQETGIVRLPRSWNSVRIICLSHIDGIQDRGQISTWQGVQVEDHIILAWRQPIKQVQTMAVRRSDRRVTIEQHHLASGCVVERHTHTWHAQLGSRIGLQHCLGPIAIVVIPHPITHRHG